MSTEVWEGGPRPLWATIEAATESWRQLGEPGWSRFGLTVVSDDNQVVWLDESTSENRWSLLQQRTAPAGEPAV